jgi:uncharacterized membrane-anchored protein
MTALVRPLAALAALALAAPALAEAETKTETKTERAPPEVSWTQGPATVDVGKALAELKLPEGYAFAGEKDSKALLKYMGNIVDGSELGLIVPRSQTEDWLVVLEFDPMGYVKDDDKDEIDADELLANIRDATKEGNEQRKKLGGQALEVLGWSQPPFYDQATHNLTWALLGEDEEGHRFVNHNVRVLGRTGVMSVTLIDDPEKISVSKPQVDALLAAFTYKPGKTYAEWVPGDKVAEYGLTALVAAGAGAAAVKLGLFAALAKIFAKGGKAIIAGLVAAGAGVAKLFGGIRARFGARPTPPQGPGAAA